MAKSVVAFSLNEFDPTYTRVLVGNAYFTNDNFTDLGTLEVITGSAIFQNSQVENLGSLTKIGGYADFGFSQVEDLGNLTTIVGYANFSESQVKYLGNLTTIGGNAIFINSQVEDLGNLTTIGSDAIFRNSQVKDLGNLTIIYGDADFRNSQVKDLGNLTTIYGDALFVNSQVKDLGKLKTIKGFVSFDNQELADQWKKRSSKDNFKTGGQPLSKTPAPKKIDEKVGKEFWFEYHCFESPTSCDSEIWYRSHQKVKVLKVVHWSYDDKSERLEDGNPRVYLVEWEDGFQYDVFEDELMQSPNEFYRPDTPKRMKKGGRTIAQTPAPKKERIYGSEKNKPESSKDTKSAEKIEFNAKTLETIKNKVAEHNEKNPKKKVTLASAKAVVRRGMGAYSSTHRPTISGGKPNSRVAWGLARLNAFFYKIINGKSKSGKYSQDDDLINELGYKVAKYVDGGEVANIMRNEIIDILSKNAQYGKQIHSVQEVGLEVIESCIESNTYFGNAIRQANENYIMIPVNYEDKLWGIDKKVGYVYFAKPNENTKIRVEYKYDMQDYPVPILFDSEIMNSEEFYDFNDYEEIKSYKFDSEFLYRGINNDEMLSIIQNGFIKSNASMNIGKQQEETTSFAQHISQASSYAVGFNAWYDEVTFAKPKYILKVKKEGVNYKPTIETDIENEVDVYGEIPIQQIESIYEFRLGECEMGQVEIRVGYDNDFSDGSRSPMFKKVFVRKTDINSIVKSNKVQKYSNGGLIAPNGKPSNLTPEQYKLVRTKAFKDWFGDWENDPANASKVVDENGEPKVMWHYSPNEFTIFNPSAESRWVNQRKENVVWFGGNEKVISYSEGEKGFLYQCFLNVKKPIIVDAKKYDEYDYYKDEQGNKNYSIQRIKGSFVSKLGSVSWDGKRNENDGVIFYNAWDNISLGVVVAVPNANQIKLADGTNTTFDGENPDIRFMAGGQVLNLNKIRKGQYEAKSDKIEISLTNPKVLNGMGTNKWQLIIEYSNDIIVNQWFDTMNEALKTGAILLSDFLDSNNTETRFMAGGVPKKFKFDIEEDEDRTEISINGVGKVILTMTYPEYEFMDDIGEDGLEELGIEEGEIIGKIEHIQIEDIYKGKGYAKLLMKKAIEIAEEKGLMPLYLNASPMGSRGLNIDDLTAFYESFGFQVFLEQGNNNLMILK